MFKKIWNLSLVLLFFSVGVLAYAEDNPFIVNYPFDSVRITYTGKMGAISSSEETLLIKGQYTYRQTNTTTNIGGNSQQDKQLVLGTPDYIYTIDLLHNGGVKSTNPAKIMGEEYDKLSAAEKEQFKANMEKFGQVFMSGIDPNAKTSSVGKEEILGKECEVYEVMGTKIWVWTASREVLKMSGMQEKTATKIEENVSFSGTDFFSVPAGVTINPDPNDEETVKMTRMFFQMIKEGKSPQEAVNRGMEAAREDDADMEGDELATQDQRMSPAPQVPHFEEEDMENTPAEDSEETQEMTPEQEEQIREMYRQEGMQPEMIEQMIQMMKRGMH